MQLLTLPLNDQLRLDPLNARTIRTQEEIDAMASSLREVGQLAPIVVRADPSNEGVRLITIGGTRYEAARALGWETIAAIDIGDGDPKLLSMVENIRRGAMHAVDQWRAMKALADDGVSIEAAGKALGIDGMLVRRLAWLGRMATSVIDELAKTKELPDQRTIRSIAMAPITVQEDALQAAMKRRGKNEIVKWWEVSRTCELRRIPRSRAIFDPDTAGVTFEEDLFAEPGADDQFTTTDIKGFIAAQLAALKARAETSKGKLIVVGETDQRQPALPKGWTVNWDKPPKRFKKDDPRVVYATIVTQGYQIGEIVQTLANPPRQIKQADGSTVATADAQEDDAQAKKRPPITAPTLAKIASMKNAALRKGVHDYLELQSAEGALRLLLLMFGADNLSIRDSAQVYGSHSYKYMVAGLVDANGAPIETDTSALNAIVERIVSRAISCSHPNAISGTTSGQVAEWIGGLVGAGDHLPRFDTEEILKGFSGEKLIEIAREQGINDHGKIGELRKRMVNNMPGWRPANFSAPGIDPAEIEEDEDPDVERDLGEADES